MGAPTLTRWSRRTKAVLFVVVLLIPETVALLFVLGVHPERPTSPYPIAVGVAYALLLVCDILAAVMTFYVKVNRPVPNTRVR